MLSLFLVHLSKQVTNDRLWQLYLPNDILLLDLGDPI
jgi:hypothetical protein